jgi:hypothetical protein
VRTYGPRVYGGYVPAPLGYSGYGYYSSEW